MWFVVVSQLVTMSIALIAIYREWPRPRKLAKKLDKRALSVGVVLTVIIGGAGIWEARTAQMQHKQELTGLVEESRNQIKMLSTQLTEAKTSLEIQTRDCNARQIAEAERTKYLLSCIPDSEVRKQAEKVGTHFDRTISETAGSSDSATIVVNRAQKKSRPPK